MFKYLTLLLRIQIIDETFTNSKNKYFRIDDEMDESKVREFLHKIFMHQELGKYVSVFDKTTDFGKIIIDALSKSEYILI